jgi:hypothetical protein
MKQLAGAADLSGVRTLERDIFWFSFPVVDIAILHSNCAVCTDNGGINRLPVT